MLGASNSFPCYGIDVNLGRLLVHLVSLICICEMVSLIKTSSGSGSGFVSGRASNRAGLPVDLENLEKP